jgi:hypothetical protein
MLCIGSADKKLSGLPYPLLDSGPGTFIGEAQLFGELTADLREAGGSYAGFARRRNL